MYVTKDIANYTSDKEVASKEECGSRKNLQKKIQGDNPKFHTDCTINMHQT